MSAKQNSKGVRWGRAAAQVGIVGACLALVTACSGSIEETDVDRTRAERAGNSPAPTAPASSTPQPTTTTPTGSASPATSTPATSTPATSTPATSTPATSTPQGDDGDDGGDPPVASGSLSFEADIYPIFTASCNGCHGASAFAGVSVADSDVETAMESAIADEDRILGELEAGTMPPSGCGGPPGSSGGCISEEDFAALEAWYEAGAPE